MAKKDIYRYGQSPNPTDWFKASEALAGVKKSAPKPRKSSGLMDRLAAIEKILKEK